MAIVESIPGIEVFVCIDGKQVKEYDAENDAIRHYLDEVVLHHQNVTTTKYVESYTNREFTIRLVAKEPFQLAGHELGFEARVDGKWVFGAVLTEKVFQNGSWSFAIIGPVCVSEGRCAHSSMVFAQIEKTSETLAKSIIDKQKAELSDVGRISIKVYRVSTRTVQSDRNTAFKDLGDVSNVDEKALKGDPKSHGVVLGASRFRQKHRKLIGLIASRVDGNDYPKAIFHFKYRSRAALQSLLVIPRPPSPELKTLGPTASPSPDSADFRRQGHSSATRKYESTVDPLTEEGRAMFERRKFPTQSDAYEHRQPAKMVSKARAEVAQNEASRVKQEAQERMVLVPAVTIKREGEDNMANNASASKKRKKRPDKVIIDLVESDDEGCQCISID